MKFAALYSGGKDSTYAIYYALSQAWEITHLITLIPESEESAMWHYPAIKWTELQAKAMGISQLKVRVKSRSELQELREALEKLKAKEGIEGLLSGVIASDYQKRRLDSICEKIGLKLIAPLWQKDPIAILKEVVNSNFKVIVVGVAAYGFTRDWLGSTINSKRVEELKILSEKYGIHPCGEGGEFETFVCDAPFFKEKIEIADYEIKWHRYSGEYIIKKATATPKKPA
ncbi:MAG: TIGR00289 family protein [Candidatus Methanomethylicota archaeon]|nr:MAG: TIGR00289 family protein [Candidatus Verstraetearchaeota archaeon]